MSNKKSIENVSRYIDLFEKYQNLLTQNQKQVFMLYYYEDLSYAEVAKITATTRTAAYDALNKAIKKLEKLDKELGTDA
ncbi:hypothetical protein GE118_01025 [Mycoplasma sp. NEAQ87857]|uniref:sigma factor-like helix-turn-helix DNA-binding protein n=1 Tax=Mycoplasma sp. NEAQ87857 TaxID=2683967 RepID=UPI001317FAC1|nr:sigma factor-like helix-turn-helix DNA-binding protein [Mycoplasma sp. NEAQ87857]QGZ97375.1 hypothetical protein GE118_01025 [Mycoplasma sp. NEAQ87857]